MQVAKVNLDGSIQIFDRPSTKYYDKYRVLKDKHEHAKHMHEVSTDTKAYWQMEVQKTLENISIEYPHLIEKKTSRKAKDGYKMSSSAKQKLRNMLSYVYHNNARKSGKQQKNVRSSFYMEFVTLTLPQHKTGKSYDPLKDDGLVMQKFSKMLENLKRRHGLIKYVWVAERQDGKRNNYETSTNAVHYHCVFVWEQKKIHVQLLNLYWLQLVDELGYITISDKKLRENQDVMVQLFGEEKVRLAFETQSCKPLLMISQGYSSLQTPLTIWIQGKGNVKNPLLSVVQNPVDIEKVKDLKKLAQYMSKYITKNSQRIYSAIYGATRNLSSKRLFDYVFEQDFDYLELDTFTLQMYTFTKKIGQRTLQFFRHYLMSQMWEHSTYEEILNRILTQEFTPYEIATE